jgi:hypothetical protein
MSVGHGFHWAAMQHNFAGNLGHSSLAVADQRFCLLVVLS